MIKARISFLRMVAEALLWCGLTVAFALFIARWLSLANLAFLFLGPVIIMAGRRGLAGGLLTALMATAGFNFFLVPPAYTLRVADIDNLVTLLVLAATAVLASHFAARLNAQAERAEALALTSIRLADLSERLAASRDAETAKSLASILLAEWTGAQVQLLTGQQADALSPMDSAAARWALSHQAEAGRGSDVMAAADALYMAVGGAGNQVVAQFWCETGRVPVLPESRDLVRQALIRLGVTLSRMAADARQHHDQMRETVLASIGHDLRTPLTGIITGLAAIPEDAQGVVAATRAEARRMEQLVSNILDLARLRSGAMPAGLEPLDLTDAVDAVLSALAGRLQGHKVSVSLAPDLPLLRSNARMLHHLLLNLIDNAAKFSMAGTEIGISGQLQNGDVVLAITDQGRGLPDGGPDLPVRRADDPVPGSGLGLMVVTGFAKALGLAFTAHNRSDGETGACMQIVFPQVLCIAVKDDRV